MHSNANHCPYLNAGKQTPVGLFVEGCLPKRLVLHCKSQPACWSCSEENLKECWVGGRKLKMKEQEKMVQTYYKEKRSKWTQFSWRWNRTITAYLSESMLDPVVLLEFALGCLMSRLNQFQGDSYFLVENLWKMGQVLDDWKRLKVVAILNRVRELWL